MALTLQGGVANKFWAENILYLQKYSWDTKDVKKKTCLQIFLD